jgi:uncharacterized CHY-type Zn-finger protein
MQKQIKAVCHLCGTSGTIPEDYQGKIRCPKCACRFNRTGVPISIIRKILLDKLADFEKVGFTHVVWVTANDEYVCKACKDKEDKKFTISQMKDVLSNSFCDSDPFEQSCRCVICVAK